MNDNRFFTLAPTVMPNTEAVLIVLGWWLWETEDILLDEIMAIGRGEGHAR